MTRHRDLEADLHPSVIAARHLRATADAWPDLLVALGKQGSLLTGRVSGTSEQPLPINVHVSDVIAEIRGWVYFWVRVLQEESDWQVPPVDELDAPVLLRELAERTGHFTEHEDRELAASFIEECAQTRRKVEETAHPSGRRKIPLHYACLEEVDGKPCLGEYYVPLDPDQRLQSDMVCDRDKRHRITPDVWQRLQRKHLDEGAARRFLAAIKGGTTPAANLRTTRQSKRPA